MANCAGYVVHAYLITRGVVCSIVQRGYVQPRNKPEESRLEMVSGGGMDRGKDLNLRPLGYEGNQPGDSDGLPIISKSPIEEAETQENRMNIDESQGN